MASPLTPGVHSLLIWLDLWPFVAEGVSEESLVGSSLSSHSTVRHGGYKDPHFGIDVQRAASFACCGHEVPERLYSHWPLDDCINT